MATTVQSEPEMSKTTTSNPRATSSTASPPTGTIGSSSSHPLTLQEQYQQQEQIEKESNDTTLQSLHEIHLTFDHSHSDIEQKIGQGEIKRIVCIALDQSGYSEYAFNWATENYFRKDQDLIVLLNVRSIATVPGPFGTTYMDFTDYLTVMEDQNRKESHALLHYYASILKKQGYTIKAIALRGDPRDEIIRKVKEVSADSLVIGSRGLGMVKRALLGSLSDYCVHHAECPVVVVRHPKPDSVPQYGKHYLETHVVREQKQKREPQKQQPSESSHEESAGLLHPSSPQQQHVSESGKASSTPPGH